MYLDEPNFLPLLWLLLKHWKKFESNYATLFLLQFRRYLQYFKSSVSFSSPLFFLSKFVSLSKFLVASLAGLSWWIGGRRTGGWSLIGSAFSSSVMSNTGFRLSETGSSSRESRDVLDRSLVRLENSLLSFLRSSNEKLARLRKMRFFSELIVEDCINVSLEIDSLRCRCLTVFPGHVTFTPSPGASLKLLRTVFSVEISEMSKFPLLPLSFSWYFNISLFSRFILVSSKPFILSKDWRTFNQLLLSWLFWTESLRFIFLPNNIGSAPAKSFTSILVPLFILQVSTTPTKETKEPPNIDGSTMRRPYFLYHFLPVRTTKSWLSFLQSAL